MCARNYGRRQWRVFECWSVGRHYHENVEASPQHDQGDEDVQVLYSCIGEAKGV
jgi:hypothetical protein